MKFYKPKSAETREAYERGGYRERYAMEHGNKATIFINGAKCFKWTYSTTREYQDANGATYDTRRKAWIN